MDASVIVKWFSQDNESDYDKTRELIMAFSNGSLNLFVPDLLLYELSNALLKGKKFDYKKIKSALKYIHSLQIEIFSANLNLLNKAIQIAFDYDLTIYDAIYVSLAQLKNCPFITANPRCFKKIKEDYVINLSDIEIRF